MNFLQKTLGTLTGTSIPYTFGNKVVSDIASDPSRSTSIWSLYDGTSDKDNTPVTIFDFDLKNPYNGKYVQFAKNSLKRLRSLSLLPGVLHVVDTIENDSHLYIITERVKMLEDVIDLDYPEEGLPSDVLLLGIYQIANALKFVNVEGSSIHGNVCKSSIFVNQSGEWKLGGFELLASLKENDFSAISMAFQLPSFQDTLCPPEFKNNGASYLSSTNANHAVKFDSFKLGVVIYELFNNGFKVTEMGDLSNLTKIPRSMTTHLKKLINQSLTIRYSIEHFIKVGESSFFDISLITIYKEFNELALKSDPEKIEIFQSLEEIPQLPKGFFYNKILPELVKTFSQITNNENNVQSMILFLILKNGLTLDSNAFSASIKPVVFKAFTFPDRAIRVTLLNALPQMLPNLSNYEVQDKIFPNLIQGFNDTNTSIREETLKGVMTISDKISARQLNNDLLRYLAKLQSDPTPEIRTNTILCLTQIAKDMNSNSRTTVLVTAFSKGLKDSFVPLRLNTIVAFENCIDYFSPEICCSRVLSALSPALLDQSSKVRIEAEKTFNLYMKKIHDKAATLPVDDETTMEEQAQESSKLESGFGALSLGNLGLNAAKNSIFGFGGANGATNDSTASLTMKNTESIVTPAPEEILKSSTKKPIVQKYEIEEDDIDLDDDGWGFDDDMDDELAKPKPAPVKHASKSRPAVKRASVSSSKHGLKLAPKSTSSKLKLDLELDADDDGWGDGW